jgi:phosphoglycolate phosphatase
MPTRPRAILFDWDNTLVDSWATIHEALNQVMAAMDRPLWSLDETRARVRLSLRDSFPAHFGTRWIEARQIYLDHFRAIHLARLAALPGCEAMVQGLAEDGYFLGIVSNKTGGILRLEVAQLGWTQWFGSIVGAGDAAADKPARDPVDLALAPSGFEPGGDVWFVGDTAIDVECARNSGCVPVLLGPEGAVPEVPPQGPLPEPPVLAFSDPAQLFRRLRDL